MNSEVKKMKKFAIAPKRYWKRPKPSEQINKSKWLVLTISG